MASFVRALSLCLGAAGVLGACAAKQAPATTSSPSSASALVGECVQSNGRENYQGLRVGSVVRLAAHQPWGDERNWSDQMAHYVGQATRVSALAGVDEAGCSVVSVEADAGVFFWRVRDLQLLSAAPEGAQRCGQNPLTPDYLGIGVGQGVVLGRHRGWFDDANWDAAMDTWVGKPARVTGLSSVDRAGCPGVVVDVDGGVHFWRVRDLTRVVEAPTRTP